MGLSTLVINVAYISLFASTFMRTLPRLRLFLVGAAVCLIVFGSMVGNWSMVGWNIVTGILNARQLVLHATRRRRTALSAEDEGFRHRWFPTMDALDFDSLWSMGENVRLEDETMIEFASENTTTSLIIDGEVEVRRGDESVRLGPGALVGEMSFVAGRLASADVMAIGTVRIRQWSHQRLATLDQLNPSAAKEFHRFLERDLTGKVLGNKFLGSSVLLRLDAHARSASPLSPLATVAPRDDRMAS